MVGVSKNESWWWMMRREGVLLYCGCDFVGFDAFGGGGVGLRVLESVDFVSSAFSFVKFL